MLVYCHQDWIYPYPPTSLLENTSWKSIPLSIRGGIFYWRNIIIPSNHFCISVPSNFQLVSSPRSWNEHSVILPRLAPRRNTRRRPSGRGVRRGCALAWERWNFASDSIAVSMVPLIRWAWWYITILKVVVSKIFYFHPYLGKIPSLTYIFQGGWNHQLDNHIVTHMGSISSTYVPPIVLANFCYDMLPISGVSGLGCPVGS